METIAKAFLRLASCLENAKFAHSDEAQEAREIVGWCLAEASDEERRLLRLLASEEVTRLQFDPTEKEKTLRALAFYARFIR